MTTVTIEEAQAHLQELIEELAVDDVLVNTRNARPIARLVPSPQQTGKALYGRGQGKITIVADDDEHLEHFQDYMP